MMPDFCDIRGGKNYLEESEKILKEGLFDNACYYAQSQTTGSAPAKTWYDRLGREILNQAVAFDGQLVDVETQYDGLGRLWKVSEPFFHTASPTQFTVYDYDPLGRNYQTTLPTGVKLMTDYDELYLNKVTTYKTDDTQTWEQVAQTMNGYGQPVTIADDGGTLAYTYNSMGLPKSITTNGATVIMEYDIHGNRTLIHDPDAGEITTLYNAYDELTSQTDANQHTYAMTYDKLGRMTSRTGEENTTWAYSTTPGHLGELTSVTASNGTAQSYSYDALGRVTLQTETVSGQEFTKSYAYDSYGRVQTENWNTGFGIMYQYNQNGYLSHVKTQNNQLIWQGQAYNARGQVTDYLLGDDYHTAKSWDSYGFAEQILTQTTGSSPNNIQSEGYDFDELKGNLLSRTNHWPYDKTESFYYDNLNRLTNENVSGGTQLSTGFALNGNITQKSDIGAYTYGDAGPHAVTGLTNTTGTLLPSFDQTVDYTAFNKASYISQGEYSYYITYGPDRQRKLSMLNQTPGENTVLTKFYAFGDYEKEVTPTGTRHLHFIAGGDGLAAIYVKYSNAPDSLYFIMKDHLGSIVGAINDETGTVFRQNFDAWGRKRNPVNWSYTDIPDFPFDRGYTGHEHLKWFGLINMNGRMYDAALGRFLSPDLIVQNPTNTQSYNRYSYCFNNPLNATDPSGYTRQAERDEIRTWYMNGGTKLDPYFDFGQFFYSQSPFEMIEERMNRSILNSAGPSYAEWALQKAFSETIEFGNDVALFAAWYYHSFGGNILPENTRNLDREMYGSDAFGIYFERDKSTGLFYIPHSNVQIDPSFDYGSIEYVAHGQVGDLTSSFNSYLTATQSRFSAVGNALESALPAPQSYIGKLSYFYQVNMNDKSLNPKADNKSPFYRGGYYNNHYMTGADFGNYNYGLAAKSLGISLGDALWGAGASTFIIKGSNQTWWNVPGFFDEWGDTKMIINGYLQLYKK